MKNTKAFTLIELLVVIAIIAILAAILFPVFAQAKMAAKKAVSLSNMKQTALADNIYVNDFDDILPAGGNWFNPGNNDPLGWNDTPYNEWLAQGSPVANPGDPNYVAGQNNPDIETNPFYELYPYIKSMGMLASPAASQDPYFTTTAGGGNTSYVVNGGLEGLSITSADSAATLITFAEGPTVTRIGWVQPSFFSATNPNHENAIDDNWVGQTFSNYSGNYAFADGHAKAMPRDSVTYAMYGLAGYVYDHFSGNGTAPNTTHMHNISDGPASLTNYDWESCGHVDITNTETATGLIDGTNNPCE
jgi:prepilin-type N-terminal cleavage/methylation domain-containing protein/prepilin-type processing-associated H-X9-DG protein